MRKAIALTTTLTAVTLGFVAQPATADSALVTLAVGIANPTLSIAAPTAVVVAGSPASATIATTVTDLRLDGTGWTVQISSTDLTLAGVTTPGAAGTIPANTMTAYTGDVEPTVPGTITIANEKLVASPLTLSTTPADFLVGTSRANTNTAVFTTTVKIPTAGKTQGVYTGTVTQSVS